MVTPSKSYIFSCDEAIYGFIALEIDSTLVTSGRQAYIRNDGFPIDEFVRVVAIV